MKKYNKPEIVTLALDTVDVIETSGYEQSLDAVQKAGGEYTMTYAVENDINNMTGQWTW